MPVTVHLSFCSALYVGALFAEYAAPFLGVLG